MGILQIGHSGEAGKMVHPALNTVNGCGQTFGWMTGAAAVGGSNAPAMVWWDCRRAMPEQQVMKLPKKTQAGFGAKGRRKLPPAPGGGAAARAYQFALEHGVERTPPASSRKKVKKTLAKKARGSA